MTIRKKILFFAFILSYFFSGQSALAQEGSKNFSINPFYQEIILEENSQSVPFSIEVKNGTEALAVFRLSVLDFGTLNESGGVAFLGSQDNLKYGLASWVSLENDTLVLKSGETKIVRGTIENKDSLAPGGHYGAVFFKIENQGQNEQSKIEKEVAFDPSFATLLFVRKQGGEIVNLNLKSAQTNGNIFSFPTSSKIRFQNSGNVHVTPRGIVQISDPFGKVVAKGIINEQSSIVLPETFRLLPIAITKLSNVLMPGTYNLKISYRFDNREDFSEFSQSFFYFPLVPAVVILSILLILSLLFKKYKNKTK